MGVLEQTRRFLSPLLGPTASQALEESVNFGKKDAAGNPIYEYKPLASRQEKQGFAGASFLDVKPLPATPGDSVLKSAGKAAFNQAAGLENSILSPVGVMTGAVGNVIPMAGRVIGGLFAADMATHVPEQLDQLAHGKTTQEKIEGGLGAIVSLLTAGFAGTHALAGEHPSLGNVITQTRAELDKVALPNAPLTKEPIQITDQTLDGLVQTRQALVDGIVKGKVTSETAQPMLDHIDDTLLKADKDRVSASEARVAQQRAQTPTPTAEATPENTGGPPAKNVGLTPAEQAEYARYQAKWDATGGVSDDELKRVAELVEKREAASKNTGGPPAKSGTSSLFKQAQAEAVATEGETTPAEPVTAETPHVAATPPIADPAMHQAALDSAERIATQVTSGQGDIVQRAARDAAFDKIQKNIAAGNPTMSFVRETAKEAAGKAVEKAGPSLDVENDQGKTLGESTPSEELTPVQQAAKADMIDAVQKQVEGLPTDIQKTARAFLEAAQNGDKTDLRSLGEKLGVSQTTVANHLTKMRAAFKGLKEEGYSVGPGAASISEQINNTIDPTSLKRAVVDVQRAANSGAPIGTPERARSNQLISEAEDAVTADPGLGKRTVDRILSDDVHDQRVSPRDAAVLTFERARLRNERAAWEERSTDIHETQDVRDAAKVELKGIYDQIDRIDQASRVAGTAWSDFGRLYQQVIKDDYSLEAMERKESATRGKPLSDEQRAEIKKQSDALEAAQKGAEKASDDKLDTETQHFVEATINELGKSYLEKPAYGKKVFDIARGIVDRWKDEAKTASEELKRQLGSESGAIGGSGVPKGKGKFIGEKAAENKSDIVTNVGKILRAKIGEFGLDKTEAFAEVLTEYGEKVRPHLEAGWKAAKGLIAAEKGDSKAKEVAGKGLGKKGEKTPTEAKAEAKAEKVAGDKLSQKTIVDHVRALINAGEHDTNALMSKTTEALKEHFPDLTERDVRRAFVDYGKKIFPSKEAVEVEIRENKQIVKLTEDINREMEGQKGIVDPETGQLMGAEKQGYQRDKATQRVRDLIKQRNELLKKRQGPDSPEKLASTQAARKTALENAIADTDRELKTGEKRAQTEPAPDDAHNEQLRAELQAMRDKVKEIDAEKNPSKSEAQKQEESLQKQLDSANAELAGTKEKAQPKEWKALSQRAEDLRAQLDSVRQLKKELETKPGKTLEDISAEKAQKGVDAAAAAVDRWDRILKGEIDREPGKVRESKSQLEEDLRSEANTMRKAADEIQRRENPTDKEKAQLKIIEKAIAEYERKAKALDFSTKGKMHGPDTEKITAAKEAKAAAKKVFDELAKDQRYNSSRLKAVEKRTAELEAKTKAGDFSRPVKKVPPSKNQAVQDAEAKLQNVKDTFDARQRQIEYNARPEWEKNFDTLSGTIRGGKLTRIKTLAKLASFSIQNLAFRMPLREVFGGIVSKLPGFRELAQKADMEGGFSSAGMRKLYTQTFTQGLKDARMAISPALNILSGGKLGDITSRNPLKTLYGDKPKLEPRFYDIPQMVHEMEKSPLLRGAFELYSEKLFKNAGRDIDSALPNDPLFEKAYAAAEREILMNDNSVASMVHSGINALERPNPNTKKVSFQGKAGAAALKTLTSFTKVATNHFVQTFNAVLGVPIGVARLANARGLIPSPKVVVSSAARQRFAEGLAKGLSELHPDDANSIMRQIKDGAPGAAFVALGVIAPQLFGGLDAGRKRKEGEPKFGEMKVGGVTIPRYVTFASPFLLAGQIGATLTQSAKSFRKKTDTEPRGLAEGALTAAAALAQTGPLVNEGARLSKLGEENRRSEYLKDWVRSNFVPGILTEVAEAGDKDANGNTTKRDPQNFLDRVKMEIPHLRNQVPEKPGQSRVYRRR